MEKSNRMLQETDLLFLVGIAIFSLIIGGSIYYSISLSNQKFQAGPNMEWIKLAQDNRILFQSVTGNVATGTITVLARSTGGHSVVLDSVIIKDYKGMKLEVVDAPNIDDYDFHTAADVPTIYAELTTLVIKVETETLKAGESYTVTLVTSTDPRISIVSPSFEAVEAVEKEYQWQIFYPPQTTG